MGSAQNRVILTRDVIFNEFRFFENKIAQPELRQTISQLLEEIEIPEEQQVMESMLEEETSRIILMNQTKRFWMKSL